MTHRRNRPLTTHLAVALLALLLAGCSGDPVEPLPIGASDGWQLFHPLPVGYDLNAVWGATASQVWAVGARGVIVHWDGRTVQRVDSPTRWSLTSIVARDFNDAYAGGGEVVLHFDGRTWEVWDSFPGETIRQLLIDPDQRLLAVGTPGLLVREGDAWRTIDGPGPSSSLVWAGPGGVRVGEFDTIWRLIGNVASLEQQFPGLEVIDGDGSFVAMDSDGWDYLYAMSGDGSWGPLLPHYRIRTVLDAGCEGLADNGGIILCGTSIWANTGGRWIDDLAWSGDGGLLACGYGGTLMHTADPFAPEPTWNESAESIGFRHVNAFSGTGCDDIWAAEWYGRVLHFDGQQWRRDDAPLSNEGPVESIQVFGDGWVAAADWETVALRSPDGQWTRLSVPGGHLLTALALAPDDVLASTYEGIHRWDGDTWNTIVLGDNRARGLAVTPSGVVYAVVVGDETTLQRVTGNEAVIVATLPGIFGQELEASRSSEDVWIASHDYDVTRQSRIHRFRDGQLTEVAAERGFAAHAMELTERRPDDLFVIVDDEVWRYLDGVWSRETGLPSGEGYDVIWSHPDCGVYVNGHPTYFKAF